MIKAIWTVIDIYIYILKHADTTGNENYGNPD